MIIDRTENALSINGLNVLTQIQYFSNTAVAGHLFKIVSMDIAKEISCWIKNYLKLDNAVSIDHIKHILATQTTDKPYTFITQATPEKYLEQLAMVTDDQSIYFSILGICETDVMIALALWIDSLDEIAETTINGIDPLFVFSRNSGNSGMNHNVTSMVNGIPVLETMPIKEAIKQLVELADERGLDALIDIRK